MPVYVDNHICIPGKLRICRMVADTQEELRSFVDSMGLRQKRIRLNLPLAHIELSKTERARAIELGAISIGRGALSKALVALATLRLVDSHPMLVSSQTPCVSPNTQSQQPV